MSANIFTVGITILPSIGLRSSQAIENIADEMDTHYKIGGNRKFDVSLNVARIVLMEFYPSVYKHATIPISGFWLTESSKVLNRLASRTILFSKLIFTPVNPNGWEKRLIVYYQPHVGLAATDELINVLDI